MRRGRVLRGHSQKGFTLIELLAVTAIMTVVSVIVLFNNSAFGGVVLLRNLAYDIALSVREAQTYGISVRKSTSGVFNAGYGVHFQSTTPTSYILFADKVPAAQSGTIGGDGLYSGCPNAGVLATCELDRAPEIGRGYRIADICTTNGSGVETCGLSSVDVVFRRPEPDAYISRNGQSCYTNVSYCQYSTRIVLESPNGNQKSVRIEVSGQISVE